MKKGKRIVKIRKNIFSCIFFVVFECVAIVIDD